MENPLLVQRIEFEAQIAVWTEGKLFTWVQKILTQKKEKNEAVVTLSLSANFVRSKIQQFQTAAKKVKRWLPKSLPSGLA